MFERVHCEELREESRRGVESAVYRDEIGAAEVSQVAGRAENYDVTVFRLV